MAKLGGCNDNFHKMQVKQGRNTITPGKFARNNLSKGGVNTDLGGGAGNRKGSVAPGGASQGKYKNMPRGR